MSDGGATPSERGSRVTIILGVAHASTFSSISIAAMMSPVRSNMACSSPDKLSGVGEAVAEVAVVDGVEWE